MNSGARMLGAERMQNIKALTQRKPGEFKGQKKDKLKIKIIIIINEAGALDSGGNGKLANS